MKLRILIYFLFFAALAFSAYLYSDKQNINTPLTKPLAVSKKALPGALFLAVKQDLEVGTLLNSQLLTWQSFPLQQSDQELSTLFLKGVTAKSDVEGFVVLRAIEKGQFISKGHIVKPGEVGYLAAVLKPGKRALSIPIDVISGSSGLIKPGNYVDVILSTNIENADISSRDLASLMAKTILSNARVLAIDKNVAALFNDKSRDDDSDLATATLEVSPKQAELLTVARKMGELSLSLRSAFVEDEIFIESRTVIANDVSEQFNKHVAPPNLILMHGNKRQNIGNSDAQVMVFGE